jgi:hypothetical protein
MHDILCFCESGSLEITLHIQKHKVNPTESKKPEVFTVNFTARILSYLIINYKCLIKTDEATTESRLIYIYNTIKNFQIVFYKL